MRLLGWDANARGVRVGQGSAIPVAMERGVDDGTRAIREQFTDRRAHLRDVGRQAAVASFSWSAVVDDGG